jgi:hypothetical protein
MSRNVDFSISAEVDAALKKLDDFDARLTKIGNNPGFKKLNATVERQQRTWLRIRNHIRDATRDYNRLAIAANRWRQAQKDIGGATLKISQTTRNVYQTTNRIAQAQGRTTQELRRQGFHMATLNKLATNLARTMSRGLAGGSASLRGGATSIAGSAQGVGISMRMSGLAMGQQLGQIMSGPLSGNILSGVMTGLRNALTTTVGVATIALEFGTRIASGIAGGIVKAGGLIIGGLTQVVTGAMAGILSTINGPLGLIVNSVGQAMNNVVSSVATISGEIVGQIGNALTGLGEMFRGAFQAAVNIAAGVMNQLVTVASKIAETVGGVLGTAAKAVLGVVGGVGGLALKDIIKEEKGLTRGLVLLDPSVTNEQRQQLREWVYNMRREYGSIKAGDPGRALERVISTGAQRDPQKAMNIAGAALRLTNVAGDEDAGVIARASMKVYNLFQKELLAAAGGDQGQAANLLMDKMFALKNFGDLDMGDVARRIGDVVGLSDTLQMSLDDILVTLGQLSLVQGPEQTFTSLGQMMMTFIKLGPEAHAELERVGIQARELGAGDKERLSALRAERSSLTGNATTLKEYEKALKRARLAKKAATTKDQKEEIAQTILDLEVKIADRKEKTDSKRVRAIDKEIDRIKQMEGRLRPVMDLWREMAEAMDKGTLNEAKLGKVMRRIRAMRGQLGAQMLRKVSPEEYAAVRGGKGEGGVVGAAGSVAAAQEIRARELGDQLTRVFREIEQPFVTIWTSANEQITGFFANAISGLRDFNSWWKKVIEDPGAITFLENLGSKLSNLFGFMSGGSLPDPSVFWEKVNAGLDKVWAVGGKIVDVIGNILSGIGRAAEALGGFGALWDVVKMGATAVSDVLGEVATGDYSTFVGMWNSVSTFVNDIWLKLQGWANVIGGQVLNALAQAEVTIDRILNKIKSFLMQFGAGAIGMMMPGILGRGRGAGALVPGAGGGRTAAALVPGAAIAGTAAAGGTAAAMRQPGVFPGTPTSQNVSRLWTQNTAMLPVARPVTGETYNPNAGPLRGQGAWGPGRANGYQQRNVPFIGPLQQGARMPTGPWQHTGYAPGAMNYAPAPIPGRGLANRRNFTNQFMPAMRGMGGAAARFGGGLTRMAGPLALGYSAFDAMGTLSGNNAGTERRGLGQGAMRVGGYALGGAAVGGPVGAVVGALGGLIVELKERNDIEGNIAAKARTDALVQARLGPLAQGGRYYNQGNIQRFGAGAKTNRERDIMSQFDMAIAEMQMTTKDPRLAGTKGAVMAGNREAALIAAKEEAIRAERARVAAEEERAQSMVLLTETGSQMAGLMAQFPDSDAFNNLANELGALKTGAATGQIGGAEVAKANRQLIKVMGELTDALLRQTVAQIGRPGRKLFGGAPDEGGIFDRFTEEQTAAMSPQQRDALTRAQSLYMGREGGIPQSVLDDIYAGKAGEMPLAQGEQRTVAPYIPRGSVPPGLPGEPGAPQDPNRLGTPWGLDFGRTKLKAVRNDPFNPFGQFGVTTGSMGQNLGLNAGWQGGVRKTMIDGKSVAVQERPMFGFLGGDDPHRKGTLSERSRRRAERARRTPDVGFTGGSPGGLVGRMQQKQQSLVGALERTAQVMEDKADLAKESGNEELAAKLKAAAEKYREKAAETGKASVKAYDALGNAIGEVQKTQEKAVEKATELAEVTMEKLQQALDKIAALEEKIEELEATEAEGS